MPNPLRTHLAALAALALVLPLDAAPAAEPGPPSSWAFAGDLRLRYERTSEQKPTADPLILEPRHREMVRFRVGVTRTLSPSLFAGVRLTSGARNDPNTSDVTLGDFGDAIEVSLDRAFLELRREHVVVTGGKFANPLLTTELAWDGDVNPQGVAVTFSDRRSERWTPRLVGMYFLVDEQAAELDSVMLGGQAQLAFKPSSSWSLTLAAGYCDYEIKSLRNADAGDTRSNRLSADGRSYRSDFDLLDAIVTVDHRGFGARFPVKAAADLVRNLGAHDENDGLMLDLFVGRAVESGDMRFRYGYARAETDAVLAAFSNDNTTVPTNYAQHTLTYEYQLHKDFQLNAVGYVLQKLHPAPGTSNPWITRLRVQAMVTF